MKSFQIKTRVNFGDNALDRLAEVPYKKILIVTDPFMAKSKNLNLILDPIKKAGKEYDIFQDIVPDPPIEKISLGVKKMLEYKPDAIASYPSRYSSDYGFLPISSPFPKRNGFQDFHEDTMQPHLFLLFVSEPYPCR